MLLPAYVFGTVAVLLTACCSLLGISVILLRRSTVYDSVIVLLLGLAVGALVGDALVHLVPEVSWHTRLLLYHDINLLYTLPNQNAA
jgi:uncharacterized membrane protein YfcA